MTETITVEIVYAEPERYWRQVLLLGKNASVQDALAKLDRALFPPDIAMHAGRLAVYGRAAKPDTILYENDRIELLRPLLRDPKDTRRLRAAANPLKKPKR